MPAKIHPHKRLNKLEGLEKWIYVVGILGPVLTIPQIIKILINKTAVGVSLISWAWYFFASIIFLIYSYKHKLKPLIIAYWAWILVCFIIVIEILIYS